MSTRSSSQRIASSRTQTIGSLSSPIWAKMSTLKPQTELDSKSLELQHLDLNDSAHDAVKGEMAAEHEHIQKELTLWQNLKLYRKVSDRLSNASIVG
jgi:hypothetical protein